MHPSQLKKELPAPEQAGRLLAFLKAMHNVVLVVGADGYFSDVAPTQPGLLYLPPEQVIGKRISEIFPPDIAAFFQEAVQEAIRTGEMTIIEYMLPIRGREMWFEGRISPMFDEEGQATAALVVAQDITERWQTRTALRESEERYRTLFEQSNDGIYLLFENRFELTNARFEEIFGITHKQAHSPDLNFMQLIAPRSRPLIEERDRKIEQGEPVPLRYEFAGLTADGREIEIETSVSYIPYKGGIATQGVVRDITERKRAEEQARQQQRYLTCLSDIAQELLKEPDPFIVLPNILACLGETMAASRVYFCENQRGADQSLLSHRRLEWCAPGIEPQMDNPTLQPLDWTAHGLDRWVEVLTRDQIIAGPVSGFSQVERPILEAQAIRSILVLPMFVGGEWYGLVGFDDCERARDWDEAEIAFLTTATNDIAQAIERRQALEALRESEERYRYLVEFMPFGIAIHQNGLVRMVNQASVDLLGYNSAEELVGRPALDMVHPDDRPMVQERIRRQLVSGEPAPPQEEHFVRKDGSVVDVEVLARPITFKGQLSVLVLASDISGRKRLEAQLRQAQKMEAIGRLAGGVAHDFNNLLTAIGGYGQLVFSALKPNDPLRQDAKAILQAVERAARLTQQLLTFSRRQVLKLKVVNLNQILVGLEEMLQRIIGEDIELQVRPALGLSNVRVDPVQMEQVVVNLVVNARDAMPTGGQLVLETDNAELDREYTRDHAGVTPGVYVQLSVSDTGEGISPEVREHLFEPFFTTKEDGTGLGLATSYGIVKQFGGHIQVYSELGQGSTFKVYLPLAEESAEAEAVLLSERIWPRGSEVVLVVEDNDMVRLLTTRILRKLGYQVLVAQQGHQAIELAQAHEGPIHLLLTDVVMPRMSGPALAKQIRQSRPDIRTLYMSGYTNNVISQHGLLEAGEDFISKPFTPQSMADKVRAILDPLHGKRGG